MQRCGIEADVYHYSQAIHIFAKKSDVKRAEEWFKRMEEARVQPDVTSYSSIINACAQKGDVNRAEQWFK